MDKDAIAFLDGETVDEAEAVEVEAEAPEVEVEAKAEAEPEEQTGVEEPGEPPSPEPEEPKAIPVTALLDEREKRQEAQRRAEEADRRMRQLEAELRRLQQPKQEQPDWYEDPQKAAQFQSHNLQQEFQAQKMQQSKFFAEREFGAETVNDAVAYFDRHPEQSRQFLSHPSPFHAAVEFYNRQKFVEEVGNDPEAYRAKLREELLAELQQNAPQQPATSKPKSPPPSAAKAPSVGREAIAPGSTFDQLFG